MTETGAGGGAQFSRSPADDLWRRTLSQILTRYGRLVYLASLRNADTGLYEHHGLALSFGREEADRAIRTSHRKSFADWLELHLEDQKADLDQYLRDLGTELKPLVETWLRVLPHRALPPADAGLPERRLFEADFAALLELLKTETGAAAPDPNA